MLQTRYQAPKKYIEGIVPLVIMFVFVATSVVAVGGSYFLNLAEQKGVFTSNISSMVEDAEVGAGVLTKEKLKNSLFGNKVVGTALLPSGSFSAFKVIDAEVSGDGDEFINRAKISFLSGDRAFDLFTDGAISTFYLRDGTTTPAQIMDRVIADLILENNTSYAIKILKGKVEEGKLIGDFVGQTYDSGYIIAGTVDSGGRISNIIIKSGAKKTTEVESTVAKNAISLFRSISEISYNTKVLGISDYQPTGFNKPVFDQDTGTWVFAGNITSGAIISSPIQNIINYVQTVAQSISGSARVVYQPLVTATGTSGINDIKSNNAKLAVSIAEKIATLSLDLSGITAVGVEDGSINSSDLAVSNTARGGYCLSYNSETGGFAWRSCSSQMVGSVIYEAGDGLTSDDSSGNTVFSVLANTGGGLEASASGVSLLRTCADGEVLQWTAGSSSWDCAVVSGGPGGGIATLQVDDTTVVSSAIAMDFLGTDFDLTNSPTGEGNLSIDYTNSKITRSDQPQSITGSWIFSTAPAISTISNTGTITLPTSTDTLLGRNTTDTLTNKTIAAGSNIISGLSVTNFTSGNVSQWTNDSNYLTGNQSITLSGDLSGSGSTSINATIANGAVSLAKMANLAANSIIGNNTGSAATPVALTASQVKTLLGISTSDVSGLGTIATQSAGNVSISGGNISGVVSVNGATISGGSLSASAVNGVTTANIVLTTGSYSNPGWLSGLTASHLTAGDFSSKINSGSYSINISGSAGSAGTATTATTANALSNTDSAGQSAITAINSATSGTINSARIGTLPYISTSLTNGYIIVGNGSGVATGVAMSGDITIDNTGLTAIGNSKVTLSKMANLAANSIIGNNTGSAATPIALTASQVKTLLGVSTTDVSGLGTIATQSASNVHITGGNISGIVSLNGASISGGSMSGGSLSVTAVNGVTTANIILNSGSYSDPTWITSLSPAKVLPDQTGQNGKVLGTNGTTLSWVTNSSGVAWGAITGTLSDQTDLNNALSGKLGTSLTSANIFVGNGSGVATGVAVSGDITIDNTGATTIGGGKVSLSKMANLAANSIIGNNTGSSATPIALSASDVKTLLAIANTDVSGLGTIATQSAGNVFITGGQITAATGSFITLSSSGNTTLGDANSDTLTIKAGSSGTGITFFDSSFANCSALETAGGVLTCGSDDTGAGGGISTIQIGDSDIVTTATVIDFLAADFDITNSPAGEGNVSIDYTNSKITRSDQTQSISGAWTFSDLTISDTNVPLTGASLTLDFNNTLDRTLTITNSNTGTANLSVEGTVNGATITGGSLSGTAVNGITTANILLSTGSYSNPSFISGLTASHLTAGDFSGAINSGTYSINVSGSAGTAGTATTANALANTDSAGQSAITAINSASTGTINSARIGTLPYISTSLTNGYVIVGNGSGVATGVAMSGDITIDNTGATTIGSSKVTLSKMANISTASFIGRNTAGDGAPEVLSASTAKSILSISTGDVSGLGTIATQSASNVFITGGNLSGLVSINGSTITGGSLSATAVNGVTTANILVSTGNYSNPSWISGLTASHLTAGDFSSVINSGSYSINISGSAGSATTATTANALANTDSAGQSAITAINSASTGTINSARIGTLPYISTSLTSANIIVGNGSGVATGVSMSGDVTIDNTGLTAIGSGKVSLSKMANLAANSIIGNNTGSPATPIALSASDVKTLLAIATGDISGLGTIATQSAGNMFITGGQIVGGTINGVAIGGTTASTGNFTTLGSTGNTTIGDANSDTLTIKAGSSGSGISFFDSSFANCSALETAGGVLTCGSDDTGAGGGISTIQIGDSDVVTSATTIDFLAADFDITNSPAGEGNVSIDYTNSKITRTDQTQSISGAWTFSDLTISDTNVPLTGASLTLDFNNTLDRTLTITNSNTGTASLSVEGTVNGATITGGSLSSTAVNGVTTANILLSTGSYSNPGWLSGLTASHLTAGDFSSAINSGTYSISVSGSAGSATTATTANALANTDSAGQSAITAINSASTGTINSARIGTLPYISTSLTNGYIIVGNGSGVATGVAMSGDITIDNTGATTIGNSKVTLGKIANIADATILGNNSGSSGAPIALTATQIKTLLGISTSDVSGLGTIATQSAGNVSISGGNISGVYRVNGADISGGSLSGTAVNGVTTANILLSTGSYSNPGWISGLTASHLTAGDFSSAINSGTYSISVSGSAGSATTASTANALANTDSAGQSAITAINSASTGTINSARIASLPYISTSLTSAYIIVGNGSNVATGVAMSGDVTIDNTGLTTIGSGKISLSKMANLAANSIIGNNTGSPATPMALSASDVKTLLAIATGDVSGLGTIATQSAGNVFITGGQIIGGIIDNVVIGGTTAAAGTFTTLTSSGNTTLGDANSDTLTIKAGSSGSGITFFDSSFANCSALETSGGVLTCGSDDTGVGGGVSTIKEGGTDKVTSAVALNFAANDFVITDETGGVAGIALDYTNLSGTATGLTAGSATTANALANSDAAGQSAITAINSASTGTINSARIGTLPYISTSLTNGYIIVGNGSGVATGVAMSGDVTIDNTGATTIGNSKVTLAKIANIADATILGNNSGSAAAPSALTAAQIKTLLGISTSDVSGLGTIATQSAGNVSISGGNISGVYRINGADISGGTLTSTAVNGVTTENILLSTGSYSNPGWISGLTASHLTAGDFSSVVNTGSYSINVSGSAGTVTGLSVTSGKTLTVQKSMTFTAADDTGSYTFPTGTKTLVATDVSTLSSLTSVGTLSSLSVTGAITGATATNTINGLVINSGALSNATTLGLSGAISAATATNTINGIIINSGAVSGVSTLGLSGAISGATATNTINGMIINSGAVSGVTTLGASGAVTIGSGGNTFTLDPASTSGMAYAGTVMPTRKVTLSPEYAGATLAGSGIGTMTSDFCAASAGVGNLPQTNIAICNNSGNTHNYYNWTTTQGSNQTYTIWVRYRLPDNFAGWKSTGNPLYIWARRTDATNGAVTVTIFDTSNNVENSGGTNIAGAASTWVQTSPEAAPLEGTYAAGGYITLQIDMTADSADSVQVGEIDIEYLSNN